MNKLCQLLKVINHDKVVQAATEYCETTYALHQTLKTIPKTKNNKLRKASARAAVQEMEYHLELGVALEAFLQCLSAAWIFAADQDVRE